MGLWSTVSKPPSNEEEETFFCHFDKKKSSQCPFKEKMLIVKCPSHSEFMTKEKCFFQEFFDELNIKLDITGTANYYKKHKYGIVMLKKKK